MVIQIVHDLASCNVQCTDASQKHLAETGRLAQGEWLTTVY